MMTVQDRRFCEPTLFNRGGPLIRSHRATPPPRFKRALIAQLGKIESGQNVSNLQRVCRALVQKAMDGDVAACRLIFDRLEPVAQKVKGVDLGPKRPARTITPGMTAAEAAKLYQDLLRDPANRNDEDEPIH